MPGLDLDLNSGQTGSLAFSQTNEPNSLSLFLTVSTETKQQLSKLYWSKELNSLSLFLTVPTETKQQLSKLYWSHNSSNIYSSPTELVNGA